MAKKNPETKRVDFKISAPKANWVGVAGDFNGWKPDGLTAKKDRGGVWKATAMVAPGTYEYKFVVDKDDVVEIKAKDKVKIKIKDNLELAKDRTVPGWLEFNAEQMKGKVLRLPEKTDIQQPIQEQLIVELYSK